MDQAVLILQELSTSGDSGLSRTGYSCIKLKLY